MRGSGARIRVDIPFASRIALPFEREASAFMADYGVRFSGELAEQLQVLVTDHFNALSDSLPLMWLTPLGKG